MARNQKLRVDIEANDQASGTIDRVADKADALDKSDPKVEVEADDKASATLDDIAAKLEDLGIPAGNLTSKLGKAGAAGAIVAIGAGLVAASQHAANLAFEAENLATLTGDSVEEASRLNAVWKQTGADTKDLQDVLLQMNGVLADDADLAAQLGINLNDGATIGQRFQQVAAALDKIPDAAKRSQIASKVFGEEGVRQYNNMRNAVGDLSEALGDVPEGSVISEEDVEKAREMQEQMREVTAELQAFATSIGSVVLPAVGALVGGINDLFDGSERFGQSIRGWFDGGEAQRNREFAESVDAAEAAARKFDTTLLDGVTSAAEARRIAEEYTSTLKGNEDQLHATNAIVVEWAKSQEAAAAAEEAAKDAALLNTESLRDQAKAANNTADVMGELRRRQEAVETATARAEQASDDYATSLAAQKQAVDDLNNANLAMVGGDIAVRQAKRDAAAAVEEFTEVTKTAKEGTVEYEEAADNATLKLIALAEQATNYRVQQAEANGELVTAAEKARIMQEELGNVAAVLGPGSPLLGGVQGYIDLLGNIPRNISTTFTIQGRTISVGGGGGNVGGTGGYGTRHTGGRVDPGTPYMPLSGEVFVPDTGGRVVSREDTQRAVSAAGGGLAGPLDLSDDTIRKLAQQMMAAAKGAIAHNDAGIVGQLRQGRRA